MDTTFNSRRYLKKSLDEAYNEMNNIKLVCKKFNIPFTILFHNSSFEPLHWSVEGSVRKTTYRKLKKNIWSRPKTK